MPFPTRSILGSVIIAVNGPEQHASGGIEEFQKLFISVRFLVWVGICIAAAAALMYVDFSRYARAKVTQDR